MECPYCKKEMQKGFINGRDSIRWYPEGVEPWAVADDSTVCLAKVGIISAAHSESWYCEDCRMVITPVPEIEDTMDKLKKKWDAFTQRIGQESEKRQTEREAEKHQKKRDKQRKKDPWEV